MCDKEEKEFNTNWIMENFLQSPFIVRNVTCRLYENMGSLLYIGKPNPGLDPNNGMRHPGGGRFPPGRFRVGVHAIRSRGEGEWQSWSGTASIYIEINCSLF